MPGTPSQNSQRQSDYDGDRGAPGRDHQRRISLAGFSNCLTGKLANPGFPALAWLVAS
jgi:hypothetical protein